MKKGQNCGKMKINRLSHIRRKPRGVETRHLLASHHITSVMRYQLSNVCHSPKERYFLLALSFLSFHILFMAKNRIFAKCFSHSKSCFSQILLGILKECKSVSYFLSPSQA